MEVLAYWLARGLISFIQLFPLAGVARAGRAIGLLSWWLDARHRRVAIQNLTAAFGAEKSVSEIRAMARENYLRMAENFVSLAKIGRMSDDEIAPHLEWRGVERLLRPDGRPALIAVGHFGNFELYNRLPAQLPRQTPPWQLATTYRALSQPRLNGLMQGLRQRWGIQFFERRTDAEQLKEVLTSRRALLLLLADQHAGDRGLWLPFLGRDCSCSPSPAVLALRHGMPLVPALCHRLGPVRWCIEFQPEIPTRSEGRRRSVEAVTRDLNAVFEAAIRRDPANWFWVHRRWKPASNFQLNRPTPAPAAPAAAPAETAGGRTRGGTMMRFLCWLARGLIVVVQALPLGLVAWFGRIGGQIGWWLDRRHRQVAIDNLSHAFGGEKPAAEIRAIARENYLRIAVNYLSLVKTCSMSAAGMKPHLEWSGLDRLTQPDGRNGIIAIGHFGNFELFERLPEARPDLKFSSTYRALRQPQFNELMQGFRTRFGMKFFERREIALALRQELAAGKSWLVLLADQHAGAKGVWLPFLGRECACSASPAVFALRYQKPLLSAICFRLGPTRWRLEIGAEIPVMEHGRRRSVEAVTRDLNAAYEVAIRRDPANWFWVHRRWKEASEFQQHGNARHGAGATVDEA